MSQPGDSMLGYTAPGTLRVDLDTEQVRFIDLLGAGVPKLDHHTQRTPLQHGALYLGRTLAEPRYLLARLELSGGGLAGTQALRQRLIEDLNPLLGEGTLDYTPVPGGSTFLIDCLLLSGLGFDRHRLDYGEFVEDAPVSLYCARPFWRNAVTTTTAIVAGGVGLSIPLEIPLAIEDVGLVTTITNAGSVESFPRITVTGVHMGLRIANQTTGAYVWFPALEVGPSDTLVIDMLRRTRRLNGANIAHAMSDLSANWSLARGDNVIEVQVSTGAAEVVIEHATLYLGV